MAGERPPLDPLTAENTGAAVIIVIYTLVSISIGFVVIRFWLQAVHKIPFAADDGTFIVASLWAIASTVLWTLAVTSGLGRHMAALSASNIDKFFKFEYAAQFGEIVAMVCAKAAFALLSERIVPTEKYTKTVAWSSIGAWAVFSLFALALQCPFPHPWVFEPAQCSTHGRLLYPIIAFNAITDIGLSLWVIPCVWGLRRRLSDRILVVILFGLRACILIPAITEMSMMHLFLDDADQTRATVNRVILSQITVYVSIVSAAIPRTNQFLFHLSSHRNAVALPDFEIFDTPQMMESKPDPPLQLVPPHNNVLSTIVSSDTSNNTNESDTCSPGSVTVRREIVVVENNERRG